MIGVIVPVRNGARYLAVALSRLRAQTYSRFELIVMEVGSTDGSDEIAAAYGPDQLLRQALPGC